MYSEIFPQRIKKARKDAGYTQMQIAEELDIDRSSLCKYETGAQQPNLETLAKLAQFYNTSLNWLLGVTISEENDKHRN